MLDATDAHRRPHPDPARRCSTGTAWSPARPAPARPRPCSCWPSSCRAAGVPVFAADIKGDLSGLATPGRAEDDKLTARAASVGQHVDGDRASRSSYYALGGQGTGIPLRVTMTSFGPTLLSKVLGLNDTQESSLGLVFHYADQAGLPLLDLDDLRAVVQLPRQRRGQARPQGARRPRPAPPPG